MLHDKAKILIYLADLVHNYIGKGPFVFPVNIGYVAAYALKHFPDKVEIRLFKYPDALLDALEAKTPHILGLSNYVWSEDLDAKVLAFAKKLNPKTVTVMGGPNINLYNEFLLKYFSERPALDFYVVNMGEPGFLNLLTRFMETGGDIKEMKKEPITGCVFADREQQKVVLGPAPERMRDLDEVPSPYTSGMLDEFFEDTLIPNIETNRGCPYACTFCAWGNAALQKINLFSTERIESDLEYIATKARFTDSLFVSDANFGIFPRDLDIARFIRELGERTGYPRKITSQWAKNKSSHIIAVAEQLAEMTPITASLQSMNEAALKSVKRTNISLQTYKDLIRHFNEKNVDTFTELILGLPGETKESHIHALRSLVDMDVGQVISYNLRVLNGAEMSLPEQMQEHKFKTKFRLVDTCFGKYKNFISIEAEEMVRETKTMTEGEIFYFRPVHWLIQFMWNYKYYKELLKFVQSFGINPVDLILSLIDNAEAKAPVSVKQLFRDFDKDSGSEWFDTREELIEFYSRPYEFAKISRGEFGKLNYKYMFRVLLECPEDFDYYLAQIATEMIRKRQTMPSLEAISDIMRFMKMMRIDFRQPLITRQERTEKFDFDILAWKKELYRRPLSEYRRHVEYIFFLGERHQKSLATNINNFKNIDMNFTLRKMVEEAVRISDLFYSIMAAGGEYREAIADIGVSIGKKFDG